MPLNAYFARYQSPNIIIVPTVSFSAPAPHTGTNQIADPNTVSPTSSRLNCEQLTSVNDNIGEPCLSNCNQQNAQVTSSNTSTCTEFSDNFRNTPYVIQDTISTEAYAFNISECIQDLPTSKYKSHNNLVDLTGFNLPKRERDSTSSLPLQEGLRQIDVTDIEQDNTKTSHDENEHLNYSDSDKADNISKASSTSEKLTRAHSEGNTENLANNETKENKKDMEVKMKKYFRQLWKRNFDKLKHKADKEKHGKAIKTSSKTKQDNKDSKQESSRSKTNLQKVSKSNTTKDLRNKIIDSSKKYRDFETRFMAKYHKRSNSETNPRYLSDPKVCKRDRKIEFSPDSIKKYKNCQRFICLNNDHEIKYRNGNQIKTENLPHNKIRMKSRETTTNKPVIKKKINECKQSKVNTNQTNLECFKNYTDMESAIDRSKTDRVKLIKSVVRVDQNINNNLSQSKRLRSCTPPPPGDLRSRLSRKRPKNEYFVNYHTPMESRIDQESHTITAKQNVKADSKNSPVLAPTVNKPKPKKCKQESLIITVKQNVEADSKNLPILAPTVNKPIPKKCKKIKIIINVDSSKSDSDNSDQDFNECCSSPEELSFLDDFNIDEIVNLLNTSQVEPNKTIKTDNDYKNNEQIKPKKDLLNNANMKATVRTKKEERSSHKGQGIEINSDTEDDDINIEIGSVANTKKWKDEQNMEENSNFDRNTKQLSNYITDLTGNDYEEIAPQEMLGIFKKEQKIKTNSKVDRNTKQKANNETDLNVKYCDNIAPKETLSISDDSNDIVVKLIDITDDNENHMTHKHVQPKKSIQTSILAKKVNLAKSKFQLLNKSNKPSLNRRGLENANKKSHYTQHITDKQKSDPSNMTKKNQTQLQKSEDPIEVSLLKMFNFEQNKSVNGIGVKSDVIKQLNTLDKHVKEKNNNYHNSEDTVEASIETLFNNYEQNGNIRKHIEQNKINRCDKKVIENSIQKSLVEVSLESTFNGTKHQDTDVNMDIEEPNLSGKSEDPIEASLQKMFNFEETKSVSVIGVKSDVIKQYTLDKHVKEKNDNSHNSEDKVEALFENMFNNYEQNASIRKHIEQNKIKGCDKKVKENSIQKSLVEASLESLFNGTKHQDTDINMDIGQYIRKEIHVLQTAPVMIEVPLETMNNIVDQKNNMNEIKIELSNTTDKHTIIESEEPANQILTDTTENDVEQNAETKIHFESLNDSDIIENRSRKSGCISKKTLENEEYILENANNKMDIIPVCRSSINVEKHLQTFEDTVSKSKDESINKTEKKTNNIISSTPSKNGLLFVSASSTRGTLETAKSLAENCPTSPRINIKPQNSLGQNFKPKNEPLQESVETIRTSKATTDNGELNTNITSESNKSAEEITLLPLENSELELEKSPERSNIQHETNVTTSVEFTIPDKNMEVTSQKTSISKVEKSLKANNKESTLTIQKSNVENQTKSETVKNNTQNLETIVDALSDLNNVTIKDSELGKCSDIATNNKTKQEQVGGNKSLVPDGSNNKDEIKSNKQAAFTTRMNPVLSNFQSELSEYLQKRKYTFSSVIHTGRFSTIYKCIDTKGETYGVKVVSERQRGMFMRGMLLRMQQYRSRQDSFVLYLMSAFEVQNQWCLLTEYYPKNLKQALHGWTHGFHIDQVQVLSRQLVDAVNMLTNAGILHSDIKPSHILLSSAHDRLKLCGFDRSYHSNRFKILPSNGTPSYRAPEVILGFPGDHRLDVWSTALVMFEMATNKTLLVGYSNNDILYQQLCTFGSLDSPMLEQCRFRALYFYGTSYIRKLRYKQSEQTVMLHSLQRNENFRRILFQANERQRARFSTKWQMTKEMDKVESLYTLLEQMLVLDPRNRMPIRFVGASEFMNHQFAST